VSQVGALRIMWDIAVRIAEQRRKAIRAQTGLDKQQKVNQ
jgi:hypothetical protein